MASKSWLTHQATLMLLLVTWPDCMRCNGPAVDPPGDLVLSDLGYLGLLQIRWSPPASLMNMTECSKRYQLEYFNTYRNSWTVIRTVHLEHIAQFDLMKEVRVRVYTLLSGPCTSGTMIKSSCYAELVQKPPSVGVVGTAVQDFVCVYYNRQYLECNWGVNPKVPAKSQQNLYFWHKGLDQANECPKYLISSGTRRGCNFTGNIFPEFTDINFCVNGSSPDGPLKTTFFSLQIQNNIKPETTRKVHLKTGPDKQLELNWEGPVGSVLERCLEWELEHKQEGPDGKIASTQISTQQMSLTLPSDQGSQRNCFRVRSKLHKYCADNSFWSEWSPLTCHPEKKEVVPEPAWNMVSIYVYITVAIIAILMLSLCVALVRISRRGKKPDSLLSTLFARDSVFSVVET